MCVKSSMSGGCCVSVCVFACVIRVMSLVVCQIRYVHIYMYCVCAV